MLLKRSMKLKNDLQKTLRNHTQLKLFLESLSNIHCYKAVLEPCKVLSTTISIYQWRLVLFL